MTHPLRGFDLDLELSADGPVAVAGPSGAGKSTLLRAVAGLLRPRAGEIVCNGETWFGPGRNLPPERRAIGFVFQDYALFPHMTVRGNVAYGARTDADEVLRRIGIDHLAGARPGTLSGGERQRVAVARAIARRPRLLLLDEPLSALDVSTRDGVAAQLAQVLRTAGVPALIVTHSFAEAVALAPRVVIVERGRATQRGTPDELLAAPSTPFVAAFAGLNHLTGTAAGRSVALDSGGVVRLAEPASGRVSVLVAPWEITLASAPPPPSSAQNLVSGTVDHIAMVGDRARVRAAGLVAEVTADSVRRLSLRPGSPVTATWKATATRLLELDGPPPG